MNFSPRLLMRRLAAPLCAVTFCCGVARADSMPTTAPAGIDPPLWERMRAIDEKAGAIRDLTADFEQRKFTPLLKEPLISQGRLVAKGPVMLWTTNKPHPTVMRVDADTLSIYYPDQQSEEIYAMDARLGSMTASPIPRLAPLLAHFHIAPAPPDSLDRALPSNQVAFKLTPVDDVLREHVDSVVVTIDVDQACIIDFSLTDPDAETTDMRFSNVKINPGVNDGELALHVPPGVKVSRPLQGAGQQ